MTLADAIRKMMMKTMGPSMDAVRRRVRLIAPMLIAWSLVLPDGALAQAPRPTITKVTITNPQSTPTNPFRTNQDIIGIDYSTDAAGGAFVATSIGGDIPMSALLVNATSGRVGVGLRTEGFKPIQVQVSAINSPGTTSVTAISAPLTVVFDVTAPSLTITQIRLHPDGAFEAFDPSRVYRTNAPAITFRGIVNDGPTGVPPEQITIRTSGLLSQASVNADASGQFQIDADIAGEPDGAIDLSLVASDNVGGTRNGNRRYVPISLR